MLKQVNSYQTDPLQYIGKLVDAYSGQVGKLIKGTFYGKYPLPYQTQRREESQATNNTFL